MDKWIEILSRSFCGCFLWKEQKDLSVKEKKYILENKQRDIGRRALGNFGSLERNQKVNHY